MGIDFERKVKIQIFTVRMHGDMKWETANACEESSAPGYLFVPVFGVCLFVCFCYVFVFPVLSWANICVYLFYFLTNLAFCVRNFSGCGYVAIESTCSIWSCLWQNEVRLSQRKIRFVLIPAHIGIKGSLQDSFPGL